MSEEVCKARRRNISDVQSQARAGRYVIALLSVEKNTEECILVPEDCLPGGPKENEFLARCPHCGLELAAFQNVFMHFAGLEKTRKQKPGKKSKIKSVQQFDVSTSTFVDKPNPWRVAAKESSLMMPRPSTGSLPLPTFPGGHEPLRSLSEQPSLFRFPSSASGAHQWMGQMPMTSMASPSGMLSHPDSAMFNAHMKSAATFSWQQSGSQPWHGQPHNPHLWAAAAWLQQPWAQSQWLLPPKDDPKSQIPNPFGIHPWMSGPGGSSAEQNILAQHAAAAAAQWRYDQPLPNRHGTPPVTGGDNKWPPSQDLQPPPKKQQCLNDRGASSSLSAHNLWPNGADSRAAEMSSRHSLGQEPRSAMSSSNGRQSHSSMGSGGWAQGHSSTNTPAAAAGPPSSLLPTYNGWPGTGESSHSQQQQQNDCMLDERKHRKSHHHDQPLPQQQSHPQHSTSSSSVAPRKETKDNVSASNHHQPPPSLPHHHQQQQQQHSSAGVSSNGYRDDLAAASSSAAAYNSNALDRPAPWGGLGPQDMARPNYSAMFDLRPPLMQDSWSAMRPSGMPMGWPMQPHNPSLNRFFDQVYLDGLHKNDAYNVSFPVVVG